MKHGRTHWGEGARVGARPPHAKNYKKKKKIWQLIHPYAYGRHFFEMWGLFCNFYSSYGGFFRYVGLFCYFFSFYHRLMGGHFRHLGGLLQACPPLLRKFLRVPMGHDSSLNVKFVENTSSISEIDTGRDLWFNEHINCTHI